MKNVNKNKIGFQTIGIRTSLDANVAAVYAATGITAVDHKAYAEYIIRKAKENMWWNLYHAMWGVVGATAGGHLVNWKNPGTYNLTFSGGVAHTATGMKPDGINGKAMTGIVPSAVLSLNSAGLVYYSRTAIAEAKLDFGTPNPTNGIGIWIRWTDNVVYGRVNRSADTGAAGTANSQGLWIVTRVSSTDTKLVRNGLQVGTNAGVSSSLSSQEIEFWRREPTTFSTKECAFGGVTSGIPSSVWLTMYNDIQAGQTIVSRQV